MGKGGLSSRMYREILGLESVVLVDENENKDDGTERK